MPLVYRQHINGAIVQGQHCAPQMSNIDDGLVCDSIEQRPDKALVHRQHWTALS